MEERQVEVVDEATFYRFLTVFLLLQSSGVILRSTISLFGNLGFDTYPAMDFRY